MTIQVPWDKLPEIKEENRKFYSLSKSSIYWNRDDFEVEFCHLISLIDENYDKFLHNMNVMYNRKYGRAVSIVRGYHEIEDLSSDMVSKIENGDIDFNIDYARLYAKSLNMTVNKFLNECAEALRFVNAHDEIVEIVKEIKGKISKEDLFDIIFSSLMKKGYTKKEIFRGFFMCKNLKEEKIIMYSFVDNKPQEEAKNE
jgi:hypothetical protein